MLPWEGQWEGGVHALVGGGEGGELAAVAG